jgi:hypothetical protein
MFCLGITRSYIFRLFPLIFKEAQLSNLKEYLNIEADATLGSRVYNTVSLGTAKKLN